MTSRHSHGTLSLTRAIALACSVLLVSCTGFQREWEKTLAAGKPAPGSITGAWEGTWRSEVNGHQGRLRCIVQPEGKPGSGTHDVRYHATWMGFLSAPFSATHRVRKTPGGLAFSGQHRMPRWVGGLYEYEGTVKKEVFSSTYRCEFDHGVFEMRRP
jgi:hypothetical protein